MLAVSGCVTTDKTGETVVEPIADKSAGIPVVPATVTPVEPPKPSDNSPLIPAELRAKNLSTLQLPTRNVVPAVSPTATPYNLGLDMTKDIEDAEERLEVNLNLEEDAGDLTNIVQIFAAEDMLDFQYLIDPGAGGTVNMSLKTELTKAEAWGLFEHMLWISGNYASKNKGFVNILPFSKMPQERRLLIEHDPIPNVHVEMYRLYHVPPQEVATLLKPFMTEGATASPISHLNSLLIVEAPENMEKLHRLIEKFDVLGEARWPMMSFQARYIEVDDLNEELGKILPVLGFPVSGEKGDGHSVKMTTLPRQQILVASAPTLEVLHEIQRWVNVLDNAESGEEERIYFYDVKYNTAEDLSDAISVFFTAATTSASQTGGSASSLNRSTGSRTSGSSSRTASPTNTRNATTTAASRTSTRPTTTRRPESDEPPETVFDIPVTIFADGAHNRLIIRTTPRAHAMMDAMLQRLDTPPLQANIKVMIAEIQLTKRTEFGFSYAALNELGDFDLDVNIDPGALGKGPTSGYNMTFTDQSNPDEIFGFIKAVAGEGNTRILFSPEITAISDEQATINVGDSVPVVTSENNVTSGDNISRSIQYEDTGIILDVTPHITAKRLVKLDIRQTVSDAVSTTSSDISSPTIQTREIQTSLLVQHGKTVLLGGLISTRDVKNDSGVPFLQDAPLIGKFFQSWDNEERRSELLLVITVNVIDVEGEHQEMLKRYQEAARHIEKGLGRKLLKD
jgi:general secretion pathway protein D